METEHIISILEPLANGVDPTTDTDLSHPLFRSPDVTRALAIAASRLQMQSATVTTPPSKQRPASGGTRWTSEEDARICAEYDEGASFTEMARRHARSTGAIMSRLAKLGRIDPDNLAPRSRIHA